MFSYLRNLENRLNDNQRDILKRIYEPTVVATPLSNSRRDVCILPDGEIRAYGMLNTSGCLTKDGRAAYLSSTDCGLSWQIKSSHGKMNSCVYLEKAGIYITAYDAQILISGDKIVSFIKNSLSRKTLPSMRRKPSDSGFTPSQRARQSRKITEIFYYDATFLTDEFYLNRKKPFDLISVFVL